MRFTFALFVWAGLSVLGVSTSNAAEIICGDADGNTAVTVTDGVLVLRAAAGLSSPCSTTPSACDVDGNGRIGLTDGVRTLRLAASLPVAVSCNVVNADVEEVVQSLLPFLVIGLGDLAKATAAPKDATIAAVKTQGCPLGGTISSNTTDAGVALALDACIEGRARMGNFQFDGTINIVLATGAAAFDLSVETLSDGTITRFAGDIPGRPRTNGGLVFNGGSLVMTTPAGAFDLSFDGLEISAEGTLVAGACRADDQSGGLALTSVSVSVRTATLADVHAIFDDASTADAVLNLNTGDLTSAE